MAFSFLRRSFAQVRAWLGARSQNIDQYADHHYHGRLINRFGRVDLVTWLHTLPSQQLIPETTLATLKKPIPVQVSMNMTPKSVLVCAGCGSITDPRASHIPCTALGCGSELKLADVCTCIHLPIDANGVKTHRIYLHRCQVHDE